MAGKVVPLGDKGQGYATRAQSARMPANAPAPRARAPGVNLPARAGTAPDGRFVTQRGFSARMNWNPKA